MFGGNGNLTSGSVCIRSGKHVLMQGPSSSWRCALGLVPTKPSFFFLCRQRRAVCVGQEYPRVPGNRPPGRPVLPMEGEAGLGGMRGAYRAGSREVAAAPRVRLSQHQLPGRPPSSCPIASGEATQVRSQLLRGAVACVGLPSHSAL